MARGYSASRANSKRPTLRLKRERSASMHALRRNVEKANASDGTVDVVGKSANKNDKNDVMKKEPPQQQQQQQQDGRKTARSRSARQPAASSNGATGGDKCRAASSAQKRSASTLRMQLAEMEEEMPSDFEPSEDERETVEKPDVMTKYKAVGKVVDEVLDVLTAACVPGANTKTLCDTGDLEIMSRLKPLFSKAKDENGKRIQKGICYPTNVSVNEVLCNHSPFREDEAIKLQAQQVVKLHCGCHLDGYPVVAARTVVVPSADEAAGSHKKASAKATSYELSQSASNAIEAARVSLGGMIKMLRPGTVNADITDFIASVGGCFGAEAVEGVLSNRVKRWVLDGVDCIIARRVVETVPQQDVEECEVAPYQVWALDIAFTNCLSLDNKDGAEAARNEEEATAAESSESTSRKLFSASADDQRSFRTTPTEEAVTIFRRTPMEFPNDARVQQANEVLTELTDKYGCFPFHFKSLSNPLRAKMGINVLLKHQVVDKMPALRVKNALSGRRVTARFSATVAVTGKRITVLCGAPPEQPVAHIPATVAPRPVLAVGETGMLPQNLVQVLSQPLEFGTSAALKKAAAAAEANQKSKGKTGGNQPPEKKRARQEKS